MTQSALSSLALVCVIMATASCSGARGDKCKKAENCKKALSCFLPQVLLKDQQGTVYAFEELKLYLAQGTCVSRADLQAAAARFCLEGRACVEEGACQAIAGKCQAVRDADCQASKGCNSKGCKMSGDCRAIEGKCAPLTDADCRQSFFCL